MTDSNSDRDLEPGDKRLENDPEWAEYSEYSHRVWRTKGRYPSSFECYRAATRRQRERDAEEVQRECAHVTRRCDPEYEEVCVACRVAANIRGDR